MAEYIEREKLIEHLKKDPLFDLVERYGITGVIESIPAADVRPVVRGKWSVHEIYKHELSYGATAYEPVYECSACGGWMESYLRYDEPIMPEDADFPRYCPNCGADMREES